MRSTVICIAGPSGSGKSTLADNLAKQLGEDKCLIVHVDNYYKDLKNIEMNERNKINFDDPESIDFGLLAKHVRDLKQGLTIQAPEWDFTTHTRRLNACEINPEGKHYIFVEGIFALQQSLHKISDLDIYVDTHAGLCLERRIRRDMTERARTVESILNQYIATVQPMQVLHVEPTKQYANIVVADSDDVNEILASIADLAKDEMTIIREDLSTAAASVAGLFGNWMNYAVKKLEAAERVVGDYLVEPEAAALPTPSPTAQ